jgi:hypothetical protein
VRPSRMADDMPGMRGGYRGPAVRGGGHAGAIKL